MSLKLTVVASLLFSTLSLAGVVAYQSRVIQHQRKYVLLDAIDSAKLAQCEIARRQCLVMPKPAPEAKKIEPQGFGCPTPPEARGPKEYPQNEQRRRATGRL